MKENEFSSIFIKPLHNERIPLSNINKEIYEEIIELSNIFLLSSLVLKNISYKHEDPNFLIESLTKQSHILNFKYLINQKEVIKIAKLFNENGIEHIFLKGSAINLLGMDYTRHARDIDVLVKKDSLPMAYRLLKDIGYRYKNPLVADEAKYIDNIHHLPILSNKEGSLVELHHRATIKESEQECPLTEIMFKQYLIINKNDVNIKIPHLKYLIAHIIYHASVHHQFQLGPIFLYDIKFLESIHDNKKDLIEFLLEINLYDEYKKITQYINKKNTSDIFGIYKIIQKKLIYDNGKKKLRHLIFNKHGRSDFYSIILRKFRHKEDLYQRSKYSLKLYLLLIIELKNHFFRS